MSKAPGTEHAQSGEDMGLISVVQMYVRSDNNEASDVTLVEGDGVHGETHVAITPLQDSALAAARLCQGSSVGNQLGEVWTWKPKFS